MRNKTKFLLPLLVILIFAYCPIDYAQSCNDDIIVREAAQIVLDGPTITSGLASAQKPSHHYSSPIPEIGDHIENSSGEKFPFWVYVTPEDQAIRALAAQINGVVDAYEVAVQWTYVSEQKLNHVADQWLTPHRFLIETPHNPSNPVKGQEVSDCEEQANTLVSLIRAEGIRPEEVRVALGEVTFNDVETGHAWVELLIDGHWVALDPGSGPYWDDEAEKLVQRRGFSFDYYTNHTFPVLQIWTYYNDIYYLDLRNGSGNAPVSWLNFPLAK